MSRPNAVCTISATRPVLAGPHAVHDFLAEMGNHWLLGGRHLQLEKLRADGQGGWITLQGPAGLTRRVRTEVTHVHAPHSLVGWAHIGTKTRAQISWRVLRSDTGADVLLTAALLSVGAGDRVMLALGGRRWLSARFEEVLDRLADHVAGPRTSANQDTR